MRIRDFRIGWRILLQEPAYSIIVILSLSLGFAACFLLLRYVSLSFGYDSQVPDCDDVYVLKQRVNIEERPRWFEFMPLPFVDAARNSGMASAASAVVKVPVQTKVGANVQRVMLRAVDPSFAEILGLESTKGDLKSALTHPDEIALTNDTAKRVFAGVEALGSELEIEGKLYKVTAILPEPPETTTVPIEALVGMGTAAMDEEWRSQIVSDWSNAYGKIYVKLKHGESPDSLVTALQDVANHSPYNAKIPPERLQSLGQKNITDIRLVRLRDTYFDPDFAYNITSANKDTRHGDKPAVLGLAAVAILTLLLAMTNYINLATVRAVRRQREIGIRKLMGASASRIVSQFMAESVLVATIAAQIGLLVAWSLSSPFSYVVNLHIGNTLTLSSISLAMALGVGVGAAAGIYPAWVALRVRAATVMAGRGNSETLGGLWLRRVLTIIQFFVAIALTGVTTAIAWQSRYAANANPGFDPASLVVIEMPEYVSTPNGSGLKDALQNVQGINGVAFASTPVGFGQSGQGSQLLRNGSGGITTLDRGVSANFFEVLGVKALAGRVFEARIENERGTDAIVISYAAARALGFASAAEAVDQPVTIRKRGATDLAATVIGVVPDIRQQSMREPAAAVLYRLSLDVRYLMVRSSEDLSRIRPTIEQLWPKYFPTDILVMDRAAALIAKNYANDVKLGEVLSASTLVAIGIAAFGIYVLSVYSVQRRRREIVLRKLHGANRRAIAYLITREFATLIAIGALIGLPIAAMLSQRYLSGFAEQAPIGIWNLVIAVAVATIVALLSVSYQVLVAMRIPPRLALSV